MDRVSPDDVKSIRHHPTSRHSGDIMVSKCHHLWTNLLCHGGDLRAAFAQAAMSLAERLTGWNSAVVDCEKVSVSEMASVLLDF